jgi:hypothetical protein
VFELSRRVFTRLHAGARRGALAYYRTFDLGGAPSDAPEAGATALLPRYRRERC